MAWKGGGGGEKGKGRASGEEVVSIALEEQPNRAELVQRVFEVALRMREERHQMMLKRREESDALQLAADDAIKTFKTEAQQIQKEKRRMLQQISLLIDNKRARLEELQDTSAPPHAAEGEEEGEGEQSSALGEEDAQQDRSMEEG